MVGIIDYKRNLEENMSNFLISSVDDDGLKTDLQARW